jgi:hypothetical protein
MVVFNSFLRGSLNFDQLDGFLVTFVRWCL